MGLPRQGGFGLAGGGYTLDAEAVHYSTLEQRAQVHSRNQESYIAPWFAGGQPVVQFRHPFGVKLLAANDPAHLKPVEMQARILSRYPGPVPK